MPGKFARCKPLLEDKTLSFVRATIILPGGTTLQSNNAMYAPVASRSLISFKDLRANDIHTTIVMKSNREALEL